VSVPSEKRLSPPGVSVPGWGCLSPPGVSVPSEKRLSLPKNLDSSPAFSQFMYVSLQ